MARILTRTRDRLSRTRVDVCRAPEGGRVMVSLAASGPVDRPVLRPVLLSSDDRGARVSLVPEGALLLAGDEIAIDVFVGPGVCLELIEPAGTVAYAMHGAGASWEVEIELAPMATLVWAGEPFVVSAGARVDRSTSIRLGTGSVAVLREMVVLGRFAERAGTLCQALDVVGPDAVPVLHESLVIGTADDHLLLGGARAIGSVIVLGRRLPDSPPEGTRLELEGEGTVVRMLAGDAHEAVPQVAWSRARRLRA